ncbi:hypothetical protein V1281_002223 [Nitrobacteraceae bacterium AZCC 2161]
MNWAWVTSLDQLWRSPTFPMWLTLAAACFFGLIVLITLLRAEKSVANGALTVITLLAIAVAGAATIRGFGPAGQGGAGESAAPPPIAVSLPALSCLDELAGDAVLAACEKALFSSAEAAASAVSYAAVKISRLTAYGDLIAANKNLTPELMALRRAVERDRYGLIAHVLQTRDHCQAGNCPAYASLTDHNQIAANMEERTYDGLIARYAPTWNAPPAAASAAASASLPASVPTGKPTTADFPSASSIPPVNIMTPEPPLAAPRPSPSTANAQAAPPRPAAPAAAPGAPAAAKKPAAPKAARPQAQAPAAPVQLAPAAAAPDN